MKYGTGFDEFSVGAASTNLTGFTVQSAVNTTVEIVTLSGADRVLRYTISSNGLALVTYDAFDTAGAVEAVSKITLTTSSDQNQPIGPALIAPDGRFWAWRANTTPTATTWRLALFNSAGAVSESVGSAVTFTEATAGSPWWPMLGRDGSGNVYGSLWINDGDRPGSPLVSVNPTTVLTNVKPGMTTFDSSDDPMDFRWFGAATAGDIAPESPIGGGTIYVPPLPQRNRRKDGRFL